MMRNLAAMKENGGDDESVIEVRRNRLPWWLCWNEVVAVDRSMSSQEHG